MFKGSPVAYFSYEACGNADCYTDNADGNKSGCPNDVNGDKSYKPDTAGPATDGDCKCLYNTATGLPTAIRNSKDDYKNLAYVGFYGTSCAPWDSVGGFYGMISCAPWDSVGGFYGTSYAVPWDIREAFTGPAMQCRGIRFYGTSYAVPWDSVGVVSD